MGETTLVDSTDNEHEFQAKFDWHVEDLGLRHAYIKSRTPRLNGKVERSHGTDQREFYQLLSYTDNIDLHAKLAEWEAFYNYHRPHGSLQGKTPYVINPYCFIVTRKVCQSRFLMFARIVLLPYIRASLKMG